MGDWHTLHLFDDKRFYAEVVPLLKGRQGDLQAYYDKYESTCTRGICDTPLAEIVAVYKELKGYRLEYPPFTESPQNVVYPFPSTPGLTYHVSSFFEYIVFSECADYSPFFRLGKYAGIHRIAGLIRNGLSYEIMDELGMNYSSIFTAEGMGLTGWITSEEAKELLISIKNEETMEEIEDFVSFLEVTTSLNMGIIAGVNIREDALRRLPPFKFSTRNMWNLSLIERLAFE